MAKPEKLTEDDIHGIVSSAVDDAVDFIESEIAPVRTKSEKYVNGGVNIGHEDGRSSVVNTKCRDVVRSIKPSLMRVFLHGDKPVEFVPKSPEDVQSAQQATDYINYKFQQLNGYKLLSGAIHEALIKKVGFLQVYYEDYSKAEIYTYSFLDDDAFTLLANDEEVEVLEHEEVVEASENSPEVRYHNCKISRTKKSGDICIEAIPSEEFFIDRNAKGLNENEYYVVGHRTEMRVSDVVAMGFDFDEVSELSGLGSKTSSADEEIEARRGYTIDRDEDENSKDLSQKKVLISQAYMRMDIEGSGTSSLYRFILGGNDYKVLDYMLCDECPIVAFEVDPEPHTFFGRSIVDLIMTDQDASTQILRGILDNVALTNTPRMAVTPDVNIDDLLNAEVGGVVRMRNLNSITPLDIPFTAGQTLGALQYLDTLIENKTGVTRASVGLDPDALQSTTKAGVQATLSAQQGQVEVIARNLAEGGMKRLFKLMLHLITKHQDKPSMMRMNSQFVPIDPRVWNVDMDMSCNVGLGTGRTEEKTMALQQALALQQTIFGEYGNQNGLVSMTNIRNTVADLLGTMGIKNADRYFQPMNEQIEQQLIAQSSQEDQEAQQMAIQNDPATKLLQAETVKAQTKAQTDLTKMQLQQQQQTLNDDLARDKMDQDLLIKAAEVLGKYGTAVDVAEINAMKNAPRNGGLNGN